MTSEPTSVTILTGINTMYDTNDNGHLTLDEMTSIFEVMDTLEGRRGGEIIVHEDGSEETFPTACERAREIYNAMKNQDGVVTLEDFMKVGSFIFESKSTASDSFKLDVTVPTATPSSTETQNNDSEVE